MLLRFEYNEEKHILYGSYSGRFTFDEFESKLLEIVSGKDYPPDVPTIWDVGQMDAAQFDWEFISKLLEIRRNYPQRGEAMIAIVAPSDLSFGVSRMYASISDRLPPLIRVFRDVSKAEEWIAEGAE